MMKIKLISKFLLYIVVSLTLSLSQACAKDGKNVVKVPIPEGTKATILVLDEKGKIMSMVDETGMEAIECELCNGEDHQDAHCKERLAKEAAAYKKYGQYRGRPLCASLTGGRTTINNWSTFSHMGHHRNPDCRAVESRGVIRLLPRGCYH